jgi:hypothetical protein
MVTCGDICLNPSYSGGGDQRTDVLAQAKSS